VSDPPVKLAFHAIVATQRVAPAPRIAEHALCLARQGPDCRAWRNLFAVRHLAGDAVHGPPRNGRHRAQQAARGGLPMKAARDLAHAPRELRSDSRNRLGDSRQGALGHGSQGFGRHGKQFGRRHPDQWQEMLRGFFFGFSLRRKLSQMLHHGIGIDLADGAELFFELVFTFEFVLSLEFVFEFLFAEKAAHDIADGTELAFVFQFVLSFEFVLAFILGFEFLLALVFAFELGQELFFTGRTRIAQNICHCGFSFDNRDSAAKV
jgi:hypothetical protein